VGYWPELVHGFQFDKDFAFHDDIGSKTDIDPDIPIVYRYILLSFTATSLFSSYAKASS
jgi:hypothetical protein